MTEWISVNDGLPESISTVLVSVAEITKVTTAWYANVAREWTLTEKDFSCLKEFTVTHWMPLPEPPES